MTPRRKRWYGAGLLVALLVLAVVWVLIDLEPTDLPTATATVHEPQPERNPLRVVPTAEPRNDSPTPVTDPPPTEPAGKSPAETEVVIKILGTRDDPVPGIGLEYAYQPLAELLNAKAATEMPPLIWHSATADVEGRAPLRIVDVNLPGHLLVRPLSLIWRLVGDDFNRLRRDVPDAAAFEVAAETREVIVRVDESRRVALDIRYADGVAFVGFVRITYWAKGAALAGPKARKDAGSERLDLTEAGAFVEVPQSTQWISLTVTGYRFGWENPYGAEVTIDSHMTSLTVVIPRGGDERGGVRVDLASLGPNEGWELRMSGEAVWSTFEPPKWGTEYRNYHMSPECEYVIRIAGPLGVWESEPFKLAPNEVREFTPVIEKPISIRLRVVNQKGEPVFPAYVSTRFHDLPAWRILRGTGSRILSKRRDGTVQRREVRRDGEGAPADTEGVITLGGISAGITELYVEAEGSERTVVRLNAKPGEDVDLGDVTVVPAVGQITIKFTHMEPGEKFLVDVSKSRRSAPESFWTNGDTYTFTGLSVNRGTYVVRALLPNLTGYQVTVTLSADAPVQEVEIDARKVPRDGAKVETDVQPADE